MKSNSTCEVDGAGQVGHEDEGTLEHADEQRRPAVVVRRDLLAEFANAVLQLLFAKHTMRSTAHGFANGSGRSSGAHDPQAPGVRRTETPADDIGAGRLAAGDGEDTVDRRGVGRIALEVRPQPRPDRPPGERRRRQSRSAGARRSASIAAASSSSSATSSVACSARRHSSGTGSRRPMSPRKGSSSWRTRLRVNAGSSFDASTTGVRPSAAHSACVSLPTHRQQRPARRFADAAHAVEAAAPQQVEQDRLGLVVGGVAGERVARQHGAARGARPGFEVRALRRRRRARRGSRTRSAPRRRARRRLRRPSRRATRGRRAPRRRAAAPRAASTSSASESGPPETASVTVRARRRKPAASKQAHFARASVRARCR